MTTRKPRRGAVREHILDLADDAVLDKGFANTSLEELIAAAGISRNGLYYHFKSKDELAMALIQRQRERNMGLMRRLFARAETLHDDPLEVYLVFTELFLPELESERRNGRSMLVSTYAFQDQHHKPAVRNLVRRSILDRRNMILGRLARVTQKYETRPGLDVLDLADMAVALVEGGIIMTDMLEEPSIMYRQLSIYRDFVRHAFVAPTSPLSHAGAAP